MNTNHNYYNGKLHQVGFEDAFFNLLYNTYNNTKYPYFVTYYNMDHSVMDFGTDEFDVGSYEFLGNLSSFRWRKIYNFPLSKIDQISFRVNTDEERGVHSEYETSVEYPTMIGVEPIFGDIMRITNPADKSMSTTFILTGDIEKSSAGKVNFIRAQMSAFNINLEKLENQTTTEYVYVDIFKKIYDIQTGLLLIKATEIKTELDVTIQKMKRGGILI